MPLARIDITRGNSAEYRRKVADIIYESMLDTLKAPKDDQFQVITEHELGDLVASRTYLGVQRSPECIFVQLFLLEGRSVEQKKAFYRTVADALHARVGIRREDVFIGLVEVARENWSFGNGEAQYALN
jgi:4-oxalocrotonate tautomerase